jgi:hypothetical protein
MKFPIAGGPPFNGTAMQLAPAGMFAGPIAIDATSVYWIDSASVKKVPIAGGAPMTLVSSPGASPIAIAVDATSLYWTDDSDGLYRVPK